MRRNVLKFLLLFSLATMSGCAVFSVGPYVVELRYDPSATPTPLPSAIPNEPDPTPLPPFGGADLTVSGLTIKTPDGQPTCDTNTPIVLTITNNGSGASTETGVFVIQVGPSQTDVFNEASAVVPALEPGAAYPVAVSLPLYATPNSVYTLFANVDRSNLNSEANEADNQQSLGITVVCSAAPNLQGIDLDFTEVNCIGETTVGFTIANSGDANSPDSTVYIDVLDVTVPTMAYVPALPPGAAYSDSVKMIFYELPDGNYRLRARIDPGMAIVEGDETDNSTEIPFAITCKP
jgi:subtilase family serine protease